ncbi:MAG TPA: NUDIX hydrolase [Spongiibacteraceae bacterium]|nr:NUDIX hydrolase [Spongiibacteraceae bacterium]
MEWYPHVTVATVIERDSRFLLVEEVAEGGRVVINQPAGHLDPDETLPAAALRETLEETGWDVQLEGVVGIALYTAPANGVTYLRTTFWGRALAERADAQLDTGILRALWLTRDELQALRGQWRSPLVGQVVDQYLNGQRYPLSILHHD